MERIWRVGDGGEEFESDESREDMNVVCGEQIRRVVG